MGRIRRDVLNDIPGTEVVSIADPAIDIAPDGLRRYKEPDDLIADPDIDTVFICTPNYLNKALTVRALEAGKHVFCEKPPAFNRAEVEEIIEVEKRSGRKLMYGFNHRHHGSMKKVKELVDSGQYGRILWMRGRYGKSVDPSFYDGWRAQRELAGGGIMMDQGIHMLDLFLMMAGEFHEVQAVVSKLYWQLEVEDNVFVILKNRDGVVASLHSTMTQWRHIFSLEVFLERGYLVVNGLQTTSGTYGDEVLTVAKNRSAAPAATWEDEEHFRFEVNNSWRDEVRQFVDTISRDGPVEVGSSSDAWKLMNLMDQIYRDSSDTGPRSATVDR